MLQHTLKSVINIEGIGLHSGEKVNLSLKPAEVDRGIVFIRSDLAGSPEIPAVFENVINTRLATTLGQGKASISTIEHLVAAIQGLGIDNILCEVDGAEIPILDGSAMGFCEAIKSTGIQTQLRPRKILKIKKRVELKIDEKWAVVEPSDQLELHATIEWDHPMIGFQVFRYNEMDNGFLEVAGARTFGFLKDVEGLRRMGLAQGGSLDNAVVLDEYRILNSEGLRYPDEFVRHKVLDSIGDLRLSGFTIHGRFQLHRSGHDLHYQLLREIFSQPQNFEIVELGATETHKNEKEITVSSRAVAYS